MAAEAPFHGIAPGGALPDAVWWMRAADGTDLRAARWDCGAPRAQVVLLSGRTEYLEKLAVPAAALQARGFSVVSLDWRGQGLSERAVAPPLKGHVGAFSEYQQDLAALLAHPQAAGPGRRILIGHSMGGAIAAQTLQGPLGETFDLAILSAPMLGIAMNAAMRAAAALTVAVASLLGKLDAWPPLGAPGTPYALSDPSQNCLTSDPEIWAWMVQSARANPELTIAEPTIGWFRAASRAMRAIKAGPAPACPTLVLLGQRESVVDPAAVRAGAARMGAALAVIEHGLHEILIERPEIRENAWAAIDGFLALHGHAARSGNGGQDL